MSFGPASHLRSFILSAAVYCGLAAAAHAQTLPQASSSPVLLTADRMSYNDTNTLAIAAGNVEIAQGDRVLHADKVTYNKTQDLVTAEGNVSVAEPDGNVYFADRAELSGDMKRGFVNQIRVLLSDNSRFAAQEGERLGENFLVMNRATYSPCDLCKDDPEKAPLWQLRAAKVTHNKEEQKIIYRDAFLEMWGFPVAYTPYFSHPDPTVKRRSGFLAPTGGSDQNLRRFARVPYYFDITPDIDATVYPTFSEEDGAQFAGEYRQRFAHGRMQFSGSAVNTDRVTDDGIQQRDVWRGHLFGDMLYNLDNEFRTGAKIAFTSDKSYLYRYQIPTPEVLVNRGFIEGFRGRQYVSTDVYYFQDIRPGARPVEPVVAPRVHLSAFGEPNKTLGGRWSLDGELLALTRDNSVTPVSRRGPDSRRASLQAGWERTLVSNLGLLTTLSANTRFDGFWSDRLGNPERPGTAFKDSYTLRTLPQADITFRYPMGRRSGSWEHIIEPIVAFTAAPRVNQDPRIVNEDSLDVEFDDTNLFAKNRFTGVDLVESGSRVTYGVRNGLYSDSGSRIDMMFGQSYRLNRDSYFPLTSGLQNKLSDYVGRIEVQPVPWFYANYAFRLDGDSFDPHRTEIKSYIGQPWFRPFVNYISVDRQDAGAPLTTVSEVTFGASSKFLKYWTLSAWQNRAIKPEAGARTSSVGLYYGDECFDFGVTATRDETSRPDLKAGDSIVFTIMFKNLGGFKTDAIATDLGGGDDRSVANP